MTRIALIPVVLLLAAISCTTASSQALSEATRLADAGDFAKAEATLTQAMKEERSEAQRKALEFERERLSRIRKDYKLTKAGLFSALTNAVRNLTAVEFDQWLKEGRFDSRMIDGELRFVDTSVSNLFFRHPALNARRLKPRPVEKELAFLQNALAIQSAARREGKPYVLPKRFRASMTVTVKSNVVAPGETIRAWLPVPRRYPFQDQFEWLGSAPPMLNLSPPTSSIRSAYFEQVARTNTPTTFQMNYAYTARGVWFDPQPSRVIGADLKKNPELKQFTAEAPHVVFTERMRKLSQELAGAETNAMLKARRCYDWISENIRYSFAREYSTLGNISDYCLTNRYGDCGQEALLFITLCRLNGIPARWQSGWNLFPEAETIHDWCELYLAPYGWMPVDPYMGIYAMQYANTLTTDQKEALRNFYFGGLTQYRMIANSDHNQTLEPAKSSLRSDNVDFQRGELEAGGKNLYFDQFNYSLSREEISPNP